MNLRDYLQPTRSSPVASAIPSATAASIAQSREDLCKIEPPKPKKKRAKKAVKAEEDEEELELMEED